MYKNTARHSRVALAVAIALSGAARADESIEEIIVTGTRLSGVEASESAAPVQVLTSDALVTSGSPDLMKSLAQVVPSFTAQAFGGDMANQTLQAKLRGLSPNHVLVLVDGKRRHTTSNLAVLGGPYQGGAGVDLNFIPVAAIEHVEVLTDGAAAQYGTDAIAGVINIITKKASRGGYLDTNFGGYMDQGGETLGGAGNIGFEPTPGGYINLTAEFRKHDHSNRGGIDPRLDTPSNIDPAAGATYPNINLPFASGYPYLNQISGDAEYSLQIGSLGAGFALGDDGEVYFLGTYGHKRASSFENLRMPSRIQYTGPNPDVVRYPFPYGFNPKEQSDEIDYSATLGLKGVIGDGWDWDIATVFGKDEIDVYTLQSANSRLYADTGATPRDFFDGTFNTQQWTTTLDVAKTIEASFPINVAFGAEYRREEYEIEPGEPSSYYGDGAQSFPGYPPAVGGVHERNQHAVYVDVALNPVENLALDVAGRYEDFSDFGDTTVGKLTARYDFTDAFALRGTYSTGFRAPTLAEEFYSAVNVSPSSAFVQLPPNSPPAAALGLGDGLKPEKSKNISLGVVLRPIPSFALTLDVFEIKIDDRIAGSGEITGSDGGVVSSPGIITAIQNNGYVIDSAVVACCAVGISIFTNGVDTRTRGADLVVSYASQFSWGSVDWSVGATTTDTKVTGVRDTPAPLQPASLFSAEALSNLADSVPDYVVNLGMLAKFGRFTANIREVIYGETIVNESYYGSGSYPARIGVTPVTNLDLSYEAVPGLTFTVGAQNLLNRYPAQRNQELLGIYRADDDNSAVSIYPQFSPFGINGGYYYGKVAYSF